MYNFTPVVQVAHWKGGHKRECCATNVVAEIVVKPNPELLLYNRDSLCSSGFRTWDGSPPQGVELDQPFEIKVQVASTPNTPFLIYNKTRTLETRAGRENCPQYADLLQVVRNFPAFGGIKGFFRARVTADKELRIVTSPVFARKW